MDFLLPLLLFLGLVAFAALAMRFGVDSRPGASSSEHAQARRGFTWDGPPGGWRTRRPLVAARHPLRQQLASALYRLADWLAPGLPA